MGPCSYYFSMRDFSCFYYFLGTYFMYLTCHISSSFSDFSSYFAYIPLSSLGQVSLPSLCDTLGRPVLIPVRSHMLPSLLTFFPDGFPPRMSGDFCPVSFSPTGHPLLSPGMLWVGATFIGVILKKGERGGNLESRVQGTPSPQGSPPANPPSLVDLT